MNSETYYQGVWQSFLGLKETTPTVIRDFPEWHRGRRTYAVWVIGMESPAIKSICSSAQTHLSEFLIPSYQRQPHVTVFVGGFLNDTRRFNDDYTMDDLQNHLQRLTGARIRPFDIAVGGINSFAAAPFLEVIDVDGGIDGIRRIFSAAFSELRWSAYVPHVTLGLYKDRFDTRSLAARFSAFGAAEQLRARIDRIWLATYTAGVIGGPLVMTHQVALNGD